MNPLPLHLTVYPGLAPDTIADAAVRSAEGDEVNCAALGGNGVAVADIGASFDMRGRSDDFMIGASEHPLESSAKMR